MSHPLFSPDHDWLCANFADLTDFAHLQDGGQKRVFTATHSSHGLVVLKIFSPYGSVVEVEREILAVMKVKSAHVPEVHSSGSVATPVGNCCWLVEQRIDGQTLRARLAAGPLPPLEVLRLGTEILSALVRAEQESIVHRDVKPDNIIVEVSGKFWLLDFGLARHLSLDSLTATGLPFGKWTPGYAPSEQFRNDKDAIDARADLFALGVTLIEAATGENPFRAGAKNQLDVIGRTESLQLPPLDIPIAHAESFRDLVSAMTQKRRDHRPASASEAAQWLGEICAANGL